MAKAISTDTISEFSVITHTTEEYDLITLDGGEIATAPSNKTQQTKFNAAERLYEKGFPLLPLAGITNGRCDCGDPDCQYPGKHPDYKLAPHGFKSASRKLDDIDAWWSEHPNANIGIHCGGDLIVLDIDGPEGEATLAKLQRELGPLPETLQLRTGRTDGGRHLYLTKPTSIEIGNVKWQGIDIRAEKGYVIAAGSTHKSGAEYRFVDETVPRAEIPPAWLKALQDRSHEKQTTTVNPRGVIPVGARNDTLSAKAFLLKKAGLEGDDLYQAVCSLNEKLCDMPLPDKEIRAICNGKRHIEPDPFPVHPATQTQTRPQIQTLTQLMKIEFPPQEWIVPDLLPQGLVILGGKSKAGKSWFVMNMCLAIAGGKLFMGDTPGKPQKILYLALEDPARRIQQRAGRLLTPDGNTDNFLYCTQWDMFLNPDSKSNRINGVETLRQTLEGNGDISLVVVDTWQRVRPRKRAFKDDYETDYAHLGQLQTMAHEHNCAILLVHHARKDNEGAEKQDSLLGSTAIAGAADLIWILERKHNSSEGLITPSGRDIEDETPLAFKCENGVWQYLGRKSEVEMNDSQKRVMEFFKDKGPQRFSEIKKALGINPATLTRALNALVAKREIEYLEISKLYKNLRTTELEENDVVFN